MRIGYRAAMHLRGYALRHCLRQFVFSTIVKLTISPRSKVSVGDLGLISTQVKDLGSGTMLAHHRDHRSYTGQYGWQMCTEQCPCATALLLIHC